MNKVLTIIEAKISDKSVLGDWYKKRLEVCSSCEFNSDVKENLTTKEKLIRLMNLGEASCLACTCEISAKASVETEDCGMIKKGLPSKWDKISINSKSGYNVINNSKNKASVSVLDNGINLISYKDMKFENDSRINLLIFKGGMKIEKLEVQTSCGCTDTSATYNKDTISLVINYDTSRVGPFDKNVVVTITHTGGRVDKVFFNIKGLVER